MNGVMAYGETKAEAIFGCKALARAVYLEMLGAAEINTTDRGYISMTLK